MSTSFRAYPRETRPYFRWLIDAATALGLHPVVTSTVRSRREQEVLYARYLRGQNRYPVARPGTSKHEVGRAIDLRCRDNALLGWYWINWIGGKWSPSDEVHYEL